MAQQLPHPVPVQDGSNLEHLSSSGPGKSPPTLSFIDNVQSAVAQIEHRLAASSSDQPPPSSPQQLPQTQPASTDPVPDRSQFLEPSLSVPSPNTSKPVSLADSGFARAINSDTSLVSSGVIMSTTLPNALSSGSCDVIDSDHIPQPQAQTPNASVSTTTDGEVSGPVSTIAPIVEQFETPITLNFTKEQRSAIVAAPIAPIVEHFEASSEPVENKDKTQTVQASDETLTTPVIEQSEDSVGKGIASSQAGSSDTRLEPNTVDDNQTPSSTESAPIENKVPTKDDIPAGISTLSRSEQKSATNEAALETLSSTYKEARSISAVPDESTPVPDMDNVEHNADGSKQASGWKETIPESDVINKSMVIVTQTGQSDAAGTAQSCDIEQNSQSLAEDPDEETHASEENTEASRKRVVLGDLSEDTFSDGTQQQGKVHAGHTSHETVDVAEPSDRSGEEEPQHSLDAESSIPNEGGDANFNVVRPTIANITAATSPQTEGEAGAPSTSVFTTNTTCGEPETPENPPSQAIVDPENLEVPVLSSGSEFNSNEEILDAAASGPVGNTSAGDKRGQSDNRMGKPRNITKINGGSTFIAPASESANVDGSRVAGTETLEKNAGISEKGQKGSYELNEDHSLPQTSGSSADNDDSSRNIAGAASRESADSDVSHERHSHCEVTQPESGELQEIPEEVSTEARKCEEDGKLEEDTTGMQNSEQLGRESQGVLDTEDETIIGMNNTGMSSMQREASTQTFQKANLGTNEQETLGVMAAKAVLARDKLAKFSLGSSVKKPHRGPFIRKTADTGESPVKASGAAPVSPGISRSPTGPIPKENGSFNGTELTTKSETSTISAIPEASSNNSEESKLRSPSASLAQNRGSPSPRLKKMIGYTKGEEKQERITFQDEQHSPLQLSQPSSDNAPRLPRVAGLTGTRSGSPRAPHSTPRLRRRTRIPRAATFTTTVPRSKTGVLSPIVRPKAGIASSPVTPSSSEKTSNISRPPLRRALSFMQSKQSSVQYSPLSRAASTQFRGSDGGSTLSLSASGSKPPRGVRPRFTIPEPFALAGPELQERSEKQMEEVRRKAAEADLRPRVFKPRPMPDFSRPNPKPHM